MDFDLWRSEYDTMTYQQQQDFYNEAFKVYPAQASFNLERAFEFLDQTSRGRITEIGGWDGQLAYSCLERYPDIASWVNIEISQDAAASTVVTDPRYSYYIPNGFAWDTMRITGDIFLATHFIEHIKFADLKKLMGRVATEWVYFESPLLFPGWGWGGDGDNHILEVEWPAVRDLMTDNGYSTWDFQMDDRFRQTGYATFRKS